MATVEEIENALDHVELQQLPLKYGHALDLIGRGRHRKDESSMKEGSELLRECFSEDFIFEELGGETINVPGAEGWIDYVANALGGVVGTQHLIAPPLVIIKTSPSNKEGIRIGGKATLRSYVIATHISPPPGTEIYDLGKKSPATTTGTNFGVYGTYRDECIRTKEGWRIRRRSLDYLHTQGYFFSEQM